MPKDPLGERVSFPCKDPGRAPSPDTAKRAPVNSQPIKILTRLPLHHGGDDTISYTSFASF